MKSKLLFIVLLVLLMPLVVLADVVENDVVVGGNDTITVGGSTTIRYKIVNVNVRNGDTQNSCNPADGSSAQLTINVPSGVSVTPSSLTFSGCDTWKETVFTSNTAGNYQITVSVNDSGGGTYDTSGATFTLHVNPPPVVDTDGDGVLDPNDACPAQGASSFGLYPNGCPVLDSDNDGIGDTSDACPAEGASSFGLYPNGCPVYDTDNDGIGDTSDACPAEGASSFGLYPNGCPVLDDDNDGIGDTTDACPAISGLPQLNGCPDTTPPSLSLPSNMSAEATSSAGAIVTYSATATDDVDGPVSVNCSPASGSTFALGTTAVSCSASDAAGNSSNSSFNVTVVDTIPPSLNLPANITAEATGPTGAVVSYSASAIDLVDGTVTVNCSPSSGSTFALGSTSVNCTAGDASGNSAGGSFSVTVVDTTPPSLNLPANITAEATGPTGAVVSYSASATDLVDSAVTVSCSPSSGSTFALGSTSVNCTAGDASGNSAGGSFSVTVVDTTPPALNLPATITAEATGATGAAVNYTASATDLVDGAVVVDCTPATGSTFALGTTAVNCTTSDIAGNTASGSFSVNVVDTTPPALSLPSNQTAVATSQSQAVVNYSASATDVVSGSVAVTCTPPSGSTFSVGTTTVNCSAQDSAGNTATGSFNVIVSYRVTGLFQPVDNIPTLNRVKAGSAIPVKFSLGGNQGLSVFYQGTQPGVTTLTCGSSAVFDDIETTINAANSGLTYDAAANQYIYVWKTSSAWANSCRQLVIRLADGTYLRANFNFTR